jgi:C-terminal processing protease CtpA/Prc
MLHVIKDDIGKNYYDPGYHGANLNARFGAAEEQIKQATSQGQAFGVIAQALMDLEDSHTFFIPPQHRARVEYGWQMEMIGDKCFVVAVKPGSDAEAKGLKPGDEVRKVDRFVPTRDNIWKIQYYYYRLRPQPGMRLAVASPDGREREMDVMAKIQDRKQIIDLTAGDDIWNLIRDAESEDRLRRHRHQEVGDGLFIWKMPEFDLDEAHVDDMMNKVSKCKSLVLDLRGNGGGAEPTLLRLLAHFFEQDITVGELKSRKDNKPIVAKTRHVRTFAGPTVVLVDSQSGSAAEVFARVIQLEKRGVVMGDRTAGAVMRSRFFSHKIGNEYTVFFGASVTVSDLIMQDGRSLERTGVMPDQLLLPTADDLSASRDPVLSRAAGVLKVALTSEEAGRLFPLEWRK